MDVQQQTQPQSSPTMGQRLAQALRSWFPVSTPQPQVPASKSTAASIQQNNSDMSAAMAELKRQGLVK